MTIQPIGAASAALYITPADLKEHGLTPAQLTLERALELTQSAFSEAGIALDGEPLDAYENSIMLSILGECALALESENAMREREAAARAALALLRGAGGPSLRRPCPPVPLPGRLPALVRRPVLALPPRRGNPACRLSLRVRLSGAGSPPSGRPPCRARPGYSGAGRPGRPSAFFSRSLKIFGLKA